MYECIIRHVTVTIIFCDGMDIDIHHNIQSILKLYIYLMREIVWQGIGSYYYAMNANL